MKTAELRSKSPEELKELIGNMKKEQFNLRFQAVTGELSNMARFKEVRKTIARAKTLLSEPAEAKAKASVKKEKPAAKKKAPAKKAKKKE
ncbi:MAG: 50S ribosomal protein L29 [Alphaproteobacteria bacterium]